MSERGTLSLRPQDVALEKGSGAEDRAALFMGDSQEVHLDWEGAELRARLGGEAIASAGGGVRPVFLRGVFFPDGGKAPRRRLPKLRAGHDVSGGVPGDEVDKASSWEELEASLDGAFSARAKGFLGSEFSLSGADGGEFGRLDLHGTEGAEFKAGGLGAVIEHSGAGCRMFAGGMETLTAEPAGAPGAMRVERGEETYEAETSLLRNAAGARSPEGGKVRVAGGLFTNKGYEATFEGEGSLPVAIFLLYHLASSRRRAFRAANTVGRVE